MSFLLDYVMSLLRRFLHEHRSAPKGDPSIERGKNFTRLGRDDSYFETEFFKSAAAPQYLVRYWLQDNQPQWHCTCPDFIHRRMSTRTMCKHCQGAATLIRAPTPFINAHMTQIAPSEYDQMIVMPIGQPLPLVGRVLRMRVEMTGSPGYVAFTAGKWRCYTCGGQSGIEYLKGKQCKHIACYSHSLLDATYAQYVTVMNVGAFMTAKNRQRYAGRAAWQRF